MKANTDYKNYDGLTELENKVLFAIKQDCFYQESFGQDDEKYEGSCYCWPSDYAEIAKISVSACKGVLGSLVKKGVIRIDDWKSCGQDPDNGLQVALPYRGI